MNLYVIEAQVGNAPKPFMAREWVTSEAKAASVRQRLVDMYGVKRADIKTTAVNVDTRKEELTHLLNTISSNRDGFLPDLG